MKLNVKIMLQLMYGFTLSIVKRDKLAEEEKNKNKWKMP